jgi:hypothetical protein
VGERFKENWGGSHVPVVLRIGDYSEELPVNIGDSHELAEAVTMGQFEKWRAQQELNLPKEREFPQESEATGAGKLDVNTRQVAGLIWFDSPTS